MEVSRERSVGEVCGSPLRGSGLRTGIPPGAGRSCRRQTLWTCKGPASQGVTAKERTVALLLLDGLSSGEIAERETNSPKTIRQHVSQIYAKCGVGSRAEFFRLAYAR